MIFTAYSGLNYSPLNDVCQEIVSVTIYKNGFLRCNSHEIKDAYSLEGKLWPT